ncbi:MAG: DNA mismatch repair protein MutS [Blastocatellales bacterium]|nr:DNA mismatch repair protein MutS [Blastocatellales bacterium]
MKKQESDDKSTPLRRQYLDIKRRYPGMIVFFQIGDFYETFDEDAQVAARELGVALTRKWFGKGHVHPLAGVPVRSLDAHLARLINRGYKVAVCDQVTPAGKGLVEREVTRIITPGTVIEPGLLEGRSNNYLAALIVSGRRAGIAYADITTGEFAAAELDAGAALTELERLAPAELLAPRSQDVAALDFRAITVLEDERLDERSARQALLDHFGVRTLAAYGCEDRPLAARAAGAIVVYLRDTQKDALANLDHLQRYAHERFMQLDPQTVRNLEIFQSWDFTGGAPVGSLAAQIDLTATPMGARLLRKRLREPLLDLTELRARGDEVEWFYSREQLRARVRTTLEAAGDIERLLGRIRRRIAVPMEVVALGRSLRVIPELRAMLERARAPEAFGEGLHACEDLVDYVNGALADRPPSDFERGNIIRAGFSDELDELRAVLGGGREYLARFEARERERTGIRSLKVGYNKVFGYYIEVTRPNLKLAPKDYIRKQTLTNAERFFTLELKEHESLIANARERILELETSLYRRVCDEIGKHHVRIAQTAAALGRTDLASALAEAAARYGYVRPELDAGDRIEIEQGRHPMIEHRIEGRPFIPNDVNLSCSDVQLMLLTAPNMAGKSVYLRQTALIVLMAQAGGFVPARRARIGLVDRIFTRIGLNDYTLRGHSSFMVEMIETAHILLHATPKSLILLDEIGRGTSTADGLSIARAVIEYVHNHPRLGARTLFATHYHELTDCEDYLPRVKNFHLAVREGGGRVEYLHRVERGRAEKSFGIYVAQAAGLPRPVLHRAKELLATWDGGAKKSDQVSESGNDGIVNEIMNLDPDDMSPVEALNKIYEWRRRLKEVESARGGGESEQKRARKRKASRQGIE